MKIFSFTVFCLFCSTLCMAREYTLEGKAGYYYPTDSRVQEIYDHGGAIYGLEFNMQAWKYLYFWSEVDYFHKHGRTDKDFGSSIPCSIETKKEGNKTHLTLVPISAGLKFFTKQYPVRFYLGAGLLAAYLHSHVSSEFLANKTAWGGGGAFKSGFLFTIKESFLINLFADYYLIYFDLDPPHKKKVITHDANLNGWVWGGGLGWKF